MSLSKAREKREERGRVYTEARSLMSTDGVLSSEDQEKFDRLMKESDSLLDDALRLEKLHDLGKELEEREGPLSGKETGDKAIGNDEREKKELIEQRSRAFNLFCRFGADRLKPEARRHLVGGHVEADVVNKELRALGVMDDPGGGYTVPVDSSFEGTLVEAQKMFGGMRRSRSNEITTATGRAIPIPTDDDTGNVGEIIGENATHNEQDVAFGMVTLGAYQYSSKIVKVSNQLAQDSAFDFDSYLARKFGQRIGRIQNTHFTTGTGSGQPRGVVVDAAVGKTAASATAVTYSELVDLEHSVDAAYRIGAEWQLNDATLGELKKLVDGNSKPLWTPGMASRAPEVILGYPYIVNNDVPAMASDAKSIYFGDWSFYWIRDVVGITVLRLVERYAELGQIGFLAFQRSDGSTIDAGQNPIKVLQQAS